MKIVYNVLSIRKQYIIVTTSGFFFFFNQHGVLR